MNSSYQGIKKEVLLNRDIMVHFPKVELHRHLEGTYDLKVLHKIALKNKIEVPKTFREFKNFVQFPKKSKPDFLLFLSKFRNDWYRSLDDIYELTYASVKNLVKDGLFYIELRFSPDGLSLHNNFDRVETSKVVLEAGRKAALETGLNLRFLVTFTRSKQTLEEMISMYEKLRDIGDPWIVGMDLAGDEMNYPPHQYQELFDIINRDNKFLITIHAGEVSPPEQIWDSIDNLHARRIGHGTSTISDGKLQEELKTRKIALEQCITSNYQTGSWADEPNHPLGRLHRLGVPVTINSDDPSIQDTDLTDDYIKTVKYFDFNLKDLATINHTALDVSFLPEDEKKKLKKAYDKEVKTFIEKWAT